MGTRTVKVDGERLQKLMRERALSPEALGARTGRSAKTIRRAMAGRDLLKSTLGDIAAFLRVEARELVELGEEAGDTGVIEVVVRGPVHQLENSPVLRELVGLLRNLAGSPDTFRVTGVVGNVMRLTTTTAAAAALAGLFPDFQEHALERISRTETGRAFFAGHPLPDEVRQQLQGLVDAVEAVAEMRVLADDGGPESEGPAATPSSEPGTPTGTVEDSPPDDGRPTAPPDNPYVHLAFGELISLHRAAAGEPGGEDRDARLRLIDEALDYEYRLAGWSAQQRR